jgi:hypothetical protein
MKLVWIKLHDTTLLLIYTRNVTINSSVLIARHKLGIMYSAVFWISSQYDSGYQTCRNNYVSFSVILMQFIAEVHAW